MSGTPASLPWFKSGAGKIVQRKVTKSVGTSTTTLKTYERQVKVADYTAITHESTFPAFAGASGQGNDPRIVIPTVLTTASAVGDVLDFRIKRDPVSGRTVWTKQEIDTIPNWPQEPVSVQIDSDPSYSGIDIDDEVSS